MKRILATTAILCLLATPVAAKSKKLRVYDEYNRYEGTVYTDTGRMYDKDSKFRGTIQRNYGKKKGFRVYDEKNTFRGTVQPEKDNLKGWHFDD